MKLFGNSTINNSGHLTIGEISALDLAKQYGTPLYVMDEELIRRNCKAFKNNFISEELKAEVIYASKAFLTLAMCRLIKEEGLSLDVVSGGELYTALKAGFPASKIYMHGNNKSKEELSMALSHGIGRIVIDNEHEINLIEELGKSLDKKAAVLLRVNPGIEAHTHQYIQTSKNSSKFGENTNSDKIYSLIKKMVESKHLTFHGFHCHIGSQIFNEKSYFEEIDKMLEFVLSVENKLGIEIDELNLGGGFGVYYTQEDKPFDLEKFLKTIVRQTTQKSKELGLSIKKLMIEPGRSIVANAGTTLYESAGTKKTNSEIEYIFVDGSMNDNIRTALYDAKYEAAVANKMNDKAESKFTIAGKCCESGDMIAKDVWMARPEAGDLIAVFSTGAYNYSMASNYNRLPRPAVVFVNNGESKCVVRRETYDDLIRNDLMEEICEQ